MRSNGMDFTEIEGDFSQARQLPRLGKIRLGRKVQGAKGTYPTESKGFVVPEEIEKEYGVDPMELDVVLPSEDKKQVFRSKYALYGSGAGLRCHGNGRVAMRYNEQEEKWEERTCTCELLKSEDNPKGGCTAQSHLMVMIPRVSMGGCWQITTRSFFSTRNINSDIDLIRFMTGGRMAFLPMKLRRVPQETTHNGHRQTHYVLRLELKANYQQVLELRSAAGPALLPAPYQVEEPEDSNPELDAVDEVRDDPDDGIDASRLADMNERELAETQRQLKLHHQTKKEPLMPPSQNIATTVAPPTEAEMTWADTLSVIDENPDLAQLRIQWKTDNKVSNISRLNQAGQQNLLAFIRTEAKKLGIKITF